MPVDARFSVRAYRHGDEAAILDLFARSFPHAPRSEEHFRWKYLENPFGNARISLAFDRDGSLVGHYAGYPVPFRVFGRELVANQIGDTMTDVSVRHVGRGPSSVLGRTAAHFYEHFCEGRVAFNFGFNVSNIQKFSLRFLRSDRVEPVTFRTADPPRRISRRERWLRGYSLELVRDAGREWDELFERTSRAYRFCVTRNAAYVRWRYLRCPDVQYAVVAVRKWGHLVGWIAYRVIEGRFVLGDLLVHPDFPDAIEVALRHVVRDHGVERIEAWFPPRPQWLDAILTGLGFLTAPEPQDLSLMCVPFLSRDAVALMRSSLFYARGDGDLF